MNMDSTIHHLKLILAQQDQTPEQKIEEIKKYILNKEEIVRDAMLKAECFQWGSEKGFTVKMKDSSMHLAFMVSARGIKETDPNYRAKKGSSKKGSSKKGNGTKPGNDEEA